jgi:PAS domain S-box-containing protein
MHESPGKIVTLSLGCGLVVLVATAVLGYRAIAALPSGASPGWAITVVVGGTILAAVLVAIALAALARRVPATPATDVPGVADQHTDRDTRATEAVPSTAPAATHVPTVTEYLTIMAALPDGIVAVDTDGRIVVFNRAAEQMFGLPADQAIGSPFDGLIPERHRDELADHVRHFVEDTGASQHGALLESLAGLRADGSEIPIEATISYVTVNGQRLFMAVVRDTTRRLEIDEELRQTNQRLEHALDEARKTQELIIRQERLRALGQLASGIAHDFNNSLSMIIGFTELLLTTPSALGEPETLKTNLRLIHSAAQDASNVVGRLREFSRPSAEQETFPPVQINDLIAQAISLTQPRWRDQAQASGRTIRVATELTHVPRVAGREGELREALTNLILNAVDAMPSGGMLTLRSKSEGERVLIEVSDTGIGMAKDVADQIFDPFFTTKGEQGTGLGLAMVNGIVVRHNGQIKVESEPGRGTTFRISLPVVQEEEPTPGAPVRADMDATRVRDLRVLLAEDEPSLRHILVSYLKIDGHVVETAANGEEALAKFQPSGFDLVITDRAMPEMGGDQLAAEIKRLDPGTPVIMLTGLGELMNEVGEQPEGVDLVVSKPVALATLRRATATVATRRQPANVESA